MRGAALRTLSLDVPYKMITGRPGRSTGSPASDMFTKFLDLTLAYRTNLDEAAYWQARGRVVDFQKERGKESQIAEPTARANALHFYKQSIRWNDEKAAKRYLNEYLELGGTEKGIDQSVKRSHPLGGLAKKDWSEYIQSINEDRREELATAIRYYDSVYSTANSEKPKPEGSSVADLFRMLFPDPVRIIFEPTTTIQQAADILEHQDLTEKERTVIKNELQQKVRRQMKGGNLTEEERQAAARVGLKVPDAERNDRLQERKEKKEQLSKERKERKIQKMTQ